MTGGSDEDGPASVRPAVEGLRGALWVRAETRHVLPGSVQEESVPPRKGRQGLLSLACFFSFLHGPLGRQEALLLKQVI